MASLCAASDAFHIKGRIGFRIAKRLGVGQGIGKGGAPLRHGRQDVVRRAVDDAGNCPVQGSPATRASVRQ